MIAPSGANRARHDYEEPAEVTPEFQAEAVEMVEATGGNIAQVVALNGRTG